MTSFRFPTFSSFGLFIEKKIIKSNILFLERLVLRLLQVRCVAAGGVLVRVVSVDVLMFAVAVCLLSLPSLCIFTLLPIDIRLVGSLVFAVVVSSVCRRS